MSANELINKLMVTFLDEVIPDAELQVKSDVANQVAAMLVNEDSVANIEQLSNVAQELAKRYKNTPRDIANVIAYLAEVLDLPAVELSQAEQDLLTKLTAKLVAGKLAVVNLDDEALKQGLPAFADKHNGGFSFNSQSGCFIRFSDNKQMLFTSDDQNVIRAEIDFDEGVVVAKSLPNYAVQDLINDVNATMETPYKIKLMEERENVTLDNITEEKVLQYLDNNKTVLVDNPNINTQAVLNLIINNYAIENELQLNDKRITIPNATEIMRTIHEYMVDLHTPKADESVPAVEQLVEQPVVVAESVETVEPTETVSNVEDAAHIVIESLKKQPNKILELLQNSDNDYSGALNKYVANAVPTVLSNPVALNDAQKEQVAAVVNSKASEIYQVAEEHRQAEKIRYEQSRNKFTKEEVMAVINAHPSHVDFMNQLNVSASYIADKIVDYFNDNGVDLSLNTSRDSTILNTLYMLALYEYNVEAIGNEEFRRINVPISENLIFDTKFFKTLIKKNFTRIDVQDDDVVFALNKELEASKSFLDLSGETLTTILGLLDQKQCTRIMSMYIIRGADIPSHDFNAETDEINVQMSYATLAVISSSKADILYIQTGKGEPTVARSELVHTVPTRMKLVDFLDM